VVVAFQTDAAANGGLESMSLAFENLRVFAPHVVTQRETAYTERWRGAGFGVRVVDMPPPASRWTARDRLEALARRVPRMARGQADVARLVREIGARVAYFNDLDAFTYGALGARAAGAKVVLALRDTNGIHRWRWFVASQLADVVVTLSHDMRARYEEALAARRPAIAPRAELVAIPSVVRLPTLASAPREPGPLRIGVVGAVMPRKRQLDLVRSLGPEMPALDAELVFVGDFEPSRDPYARACEEARVALAEPGRVRFVGFDRDVAAWYRRFDLVVIGSDSEGLARAMIETLSFGVPVVSTDVCSAREVLDGSGGGAVVRCGDFDGLRREVETLARDAEARRRCGLAGRAYVERTFVAERVGAEYDALLARLAGLAGQ